MERIDEKKIIQFTNELLESEKEVPLRANGRPRSMTVLKMQWLAERVRKCQKIKAQVAAGVYHVPSEFVAKAILNIEDEEIA